MALVFSRVTSRTRLPCFHIVYAVANAANEKTISGEIRVIAVDACAPPAAAEPAVSFLRIFYERGSPKAAIYAAAS